MPNHEQFRMIKNLLADRFKVAVHTERKDLPAYVLTVDNRGHRLTPNTGNPNGLPTLNLKGRPGRDGKREVRRHGSAGCDSEGCKSGAPEARLRLLDEMGVVPAATDAASGKSLIIGGSGRVERWTTNTPAARWMRRARSA